MTEAARGNISSFPAAAASLYHHMCGSLRGGIQITEKKVKREQYKMMC